jgi:glycosyltransferase involved in cell wall biosynthesis
MGTALVIPVYNEGLRVLEVVGAAAKNYNVNEIIAVNDGSTDDTLEILHEIDGLTVLSHPTNLGKGEALDTGITLSIDEGLDTVVFLDGDLRGIQPEHIDQLLDPIENDGSLMTIGYLGLRKAVVKKTILSQWGALSGQRALRTDVWDLLSAKDKRGFNVEAALNARLRKQKLHQNISRVALDGVGHVGKIEKEGNLPTAYWKYARTYSSAFWTYGRIELESLGALTR